MTKQASLVPLIKEMRQQGLDNHQIAQNLQREGYTNAQIFEAMNLVSHQKKFGEPMEQSNLPPPMNPMGMAPQSMNAPMGGNMADEVHEIEELIEQIIDEKWKDAQKQFNELAEWRQSVDQKLIEMDTQMLDLKNSFANVQAGLIGRMGEYDKNVQTVGSQLKAMEMAFSKVLPQFTENIQELGRITKQMKK